MTRKSPTSNHCYILSCEHGGNQIPARYQHLFKGGERILESHQGYDTGALSMAKKLASSLQAPLFAATVSRLLIDLNRSANHPSLYSLFLKDAEKALKDEIKNAFYLPYRTKIENQIVRALASGKRVTHISSHSFTPSLHGVERKADVGLLYDPKRSDEVALCIHWKKEIHVVDAKLVARRNYPYKGSADGLTTYFRKRFSSEAYIGVELEVNQKHVATPRHWQSFQEKIIESVRRVLQVD